MQKNAFYSPAEIMIVTMARLLKDAKNVFMGVASNLPFFAIWLAKRMYNPELIWLNIPGRVNPNPDYPPKTTVHPQLALKGVCTLTLSDIFDMSARGELDVAFLSGVQIDQEGNFNLSHIPEGNGIKAQFTGGAGSALIYPNTKRVILWRTRHDKRTFVKKCQLITASGNVFRVVTPIAVFRKEGQLVLESIHPFSSFEEVRDNTGFPVDPAPQTPEPTAEELKALREFDKENIRTIEF